MKQRILVIYLDDKNYVSLLHIPQSKIQLDLWVKAELCKSEYKGKEWDLFILEKSNQGIKTKEKNETNTKNNNN